MPGSYLSRSWEVSSVPDGTSLGGAGKGNRNPATHADEKSDIPIVPRKLPNNGCSPAEAMEGRGIAAGNAFDAPARRTQSRESASMGVEGIRERARQHRREKSSRYHLRQEPYAAILQVRICAGGGG
jgi:RNA-directed DNA polymerase